MEKGSLLGRKIVTLGGGTGHFALLTGLKTYPFAITAIPTSFDSGGNTGEHRDQFGALPAGDARRCLAALSNDETLRALLGFRFDGGLKGSPLEGQSLGNLMIMAADAMWGRGRGINRIENILKLAGSVFPVSTDDSHLVALLSDGTILDNEKAIDTRDPFDLRHIVKVSLHPEAFVTREAANAIVEADAIVFAPGDLYTSTIATLITGGCAEAIAASHGKLICVSNIMTKPAETRGYNLAKFINTFFEYGVGREKFDAVIVNSYAPQNGVAAKYREDEATPILLDDESIKALAGKVTTFVSRDLVSRAGLKENLIRHDPATLAHAIVEFVSGK